MNWSAWSFIIKWSIVPLFLLWLDPPQSFVGGVLLFVIYLLFWPVILILGGIPWIFIDVIPMGLKLITFFYKKGFHIPLELSARELFISFFGLVIVIIGNLLGLIWLINALREDSSYENKEIEVHTSLHKPDNHGK